MMAHPEATRMVVEPSTGITKAEKMLTEACGERHPQRLRMRGGILR